MILSYYLSFLGILIYTFETIVSSTAYFIFHQKINRKTINISADIYIGYQLSRAYKQYRYSSQTNI